MTYMDKYNAWLMSDSLSQEEKDELHAISENLKEIESRFFNQLEFGTGGLRGIMGVGLFRMNVHVIRHATQAFAELINAEPLNPDSKTEKCVAICYDSRINSEKFAKEAACVIAGNGIKVRIFDALRPTPCLSFAVRQYNCIAGINITASHNPKEYNGYKVYWSDGAQLPPQHAKQVADKMSKIDIFSSIRKIEYEEAKNQRLISIMSEETDELFLKNALGQATDFEAVNVISDTFKLVYTPFHGAGYKLVPEVLRRLGMRHIICVPEQMELDGNFPTVTSPNPEYPEGFYLAVDLAKANGADLIVGTDPDCDRVGIMVRDDCGSFIPITGNQVGVLLLDYLIDAKKQAGTLPDKPVVLKTIVTTEMARRIAETHNVECYDTFTGFKFMAEKKNILEAAGTGHVFFSFEESYGYMAGDYVRDKDAVTASMLIAEMAAKYASRSMTLYDALIKLYEKYGQYAEKTVEIQMPGLDGIEKMRNLMSNLRDNPPEEIAETKIIRRSDYLSGQQYDVTTDDVTPIELFGSNVMRFETIDGTVILVRPSGTEPKVKIYIMTSGNTQAECDAKINRYITWSETLKS